MQLKAKLLPLILIPLLGCSSSENETNIEVPFTSQAPEMNWAEPWLNACEETSIVMINAFYEDETGEEITPTQARKQILEVFSTKRKSVSISKDESMQTIVTLIEELDLNWEAEIKTNPSIENIKNELSENRPIIAPVFAPELDNPYYTGSGPDYHVLVITGFDDNTQEFIVNDPGTQFGNELRFEYQKFMDSIHDLHPKEEQSGQKSVLFTKRKFAFSIP